MTTDPPLILLPDGSWIDPRHVRAVLVADRSDDYPGIRERVLIRTEGGGTEVVEGFGSLDRAKAWAAVFAAGVNESRTPMS